MDDNIIHCPKCKSDNLNSFDNEPLEIIPKEMFEGKNISRQYDPEIYLKFKCHNCEHEFTKTFDLIPRKEWVTKDKPAFHPENLIMQGPRKMRVNKYWQTGSLVVRTLGKPHKGENGFQMLVRDNKKREILIHWDETLDQWQFEDGYSTVYLNNE